MSHREVLDDCPDLTVVPCPRQASIVRIPVAGTPFALVYASDRPAGAPSWAGWSIDALHTFLVESGRLVRGDGTSRTVQPIRRQRRLLVADALAATVGEFDARGRLLRSIDGLTGITRLSFSRDSRGRLTTIRPAGRRELTLRYASAKDSTPSSLVVARGPVTRVHLDDHGRPVRVLGPGGARWEVSYEGNAVSSVTDGVGGRTAFRYDRTGRLIERTDQSGVTGYRREQTAGTSRLVVRGPRGTHTVSVRREGGALHRNLVVAGRSRVSETIESASRRRVELGDGRVVTVGLEPDPRFGWQVPLPVEQRVRLPSGLSSTITLNRTTVLARQHDPLSATRLRDVWAGAPDAAVWEYVADDRTITRTSPEGRVTTWHVDHAGRIDRVDAPEMPAEHVEFDEAGRLKSIGIGDVRVARRWQGRHLEEAWPGGSARRWWFDRAGRVAEAQSGAGAPARATYDAAGNLSAIAPPGQPEHVLLVDGDGRRVGRVPPSVDGAGVDDVSMVYEHGRLAGADLAGTPEYRVEHDENGLPVRLAGRDVTADMVWDRSSPFLREVRVDGGPALRMTRDGPNLVEAAWSTPVEAVVEGSYDGAGRLRSYRVNGVDVPISRDRDGLYVGVGPVRIERDRATGQVRSLETGKVAVDLRYHHGLLVEQVVRGRDPVAAIAYERDDLGRIVGEASTVAGRHHDQTYAYDDQGRLRAATVSGQATTLTLDHNGNITTWTVDGVPPRHDVVDGRARLLVAGDRRVGYDAAGRVVSVAGPKGATSYGYDALGRLSRIAGPDGHSVEYVIDGVGRRVGKQVDGKLVAAWVYQDDLRPIAQLAGDGRVDQLYLYDERGVLVGLVRDGRSYVVVADQRGSPRLVVDGTTGDVVQSRTYDSFGNVVEDTNPGFQPFGFNGGLEDPATGLVHLGARDYSPSLGRFMSPDPLAFAAAETNLYRFGLGDPVNRTDPTGLDTLTTWGACVGVTSYPGFGGAVKICYQSFSDGSWGVYGYGALGAGAEFGAGPEVNWGTFIGENEDGKSGSELFEGTGESKGGSAGFSVEYSDPPGGSSGFEQWSFGFGEGGFHWAPLGAYRCILCSHQLGDGPDSPEGEPELPELDEPAQGYGDPHVWTADGTHFSFQAAGEYVALASSEPGFAVQARQERWRDTNVTIVTAVATDVAGDRVGLYAGAGRNDPVAIRVNGEPASAALDGTPLALGKGGTVTQSGRHTWVTWPDGSVVAVAPQARGLHVSIDPSRERAPTVRGAWGDDDGNRANDLQTAQGATIATDPVTGDPAFETLYGAFARSWLVTGSGSLFDYEPGESSESFLVPGFPTQPVTPEPFDEGRRAAAERVCRTVAGGHDHVLRNCMVDVLTTGDTGFVGTARLVVAGPSGARAAAGVPGRGTERPGPRAGYEIDVGQGVAPDRPGPGAGQLGDRGERDDFVFEADAGPMFLRPGPAGNCAVQADVYDGDDRLAAVLLCGDGKRFTLPRSGRYRVEVSGGPGPYEFRVLAVTTFTAEVGEVVGHGRPGPGAGDSDVPDDYTFEADAGPMFLRPGPAGNCAVQADVYDGDDRLAAVLLCGDGKRFTLPRSGRYRVKVSGGPGPYEFRLERG